MNIFAFGDGGVSEEVRLLYPLAQMVASKDFEYTLRTATIKEGTKIPIDKEAIYIFSRPMIVTEHAFHQIKEMGMPTVVDVDDNFWALPKSHIGYSVVGPESLNVRSLERILRIADRVVTSTEPLKKEIVDRGLVEESKITVIKNVCNSHNQYVGFKRPSNKVRYGFSGTKTHREDFKILLRPLLQFASEHDNVQVITAVDPELYRMLRKLPEQKKLFVPACDYKYYPVQLGYFDVIMVPLANNAFNHSKSDIKILDAIVNGKPFVASAVEPYLEYKDSGAGYVIGNSEEEWYKAFTDLLSPEKRESFSNAGVELAKLHHVSKSADSWKRLLKELK